MGERGQDGRGVEIKDAEQKREKRLGTNEESLRELGDNVKRITSGIIGAPEGEGREETEKKMPRGNSPKLP